MEIPPVSNAWFYVNNSGYFGFVNFNFASSGSSFEGSVRPHPDKEFVHASQRRDKLSKNNFVNLLDIFYDVPPRYHHFLRLIL